MQLSNDQKKPKKQQVASNTTLMQGRHHLMKLQAREGRKGELAL
jgi:hypothetical protein